MSRTSFRDSSSDDIYQRFENEIKMWAELKNIHILPFYGIVTDLGQHIHMVIEIHFCGWFSILKLCSGFSMARKWKCSWVSVTDQCSPCHLFHILSIRYIKQHSDADRLLLVSLPPYWPIILQYLPGKQIYGAAQGLKYLHSENVIHGNGELSDSYIWLKYSAYHWSIVKCVRLYLIA